MSPMTELQKWNAAKDACRITGCAEVRGKTTRTPRNFLRGRERHLVENGVPAAESADGRTFYERVRFARKRTDYVRVLRRTKQ